MSPASLAKLAACDSIHTRGVIMATRYIHLTDEQDGFVAEY
jgi:hypothetical protein